MEQHHNEIMNTDASPATPRRGRKRACAPSNEVQVVSRLEINEERQYQVALQSPEVKEALFKHEVAQARRDSISRKLCGGSNAVTVSDLAHGEELLSTAKKALLQLARCHSILERHPVIAALLAHSN